MRSMNQPPPNRQPSRQQLARSATGPARQVAIEIVDETGSTNADLLARAPGLAGPVLLVARSQTAGRGRAGRSWQSAPDASLTFSLAWKFDRALPQLVGLPLAAGVAIADALHACGVDARLKWPNDVLLDERKLAGILIETAAARDGIWAIIGIGINLALPPALAERIGATAAALPQLAAAPDDLLAALLNALARALTEFGDAGLAPFTQRWNALHAWAGQQVRVLDHGQVRQQGAAVGIDDSGRLLIDSADGRVAVLSGDVSLRRTGAPPCCS
ncbi:BirA family transcriptional regulator, biotin operon repressor / biotin-[acetyl-CoA-carboxylase] ligase [Noviherbaspirillum suwonense]|uniref:biotin--[biotin carboxyl-carrier protein] ligase n=2 Tax=Noviherbaspirillum suwonense TaxID=1224511 RepID=A0ABY1QLY9_9BURK|nr:BirA family transcriptional regulator, biotin operon repressor / biotin-[acetyl-CoA-carboxylase] ligase [Noviherbaspirillum suwonense]